MWHCYWLPTNIKYDQTSPITTITEISIISVSVVSKFVATCSGTRDWEMSAQSARLKNLPSKIFEGKFYVAFCKSRANFTFKKFFRGVWSHLKVLRDEILTSTYLKGFFLMGLSQIFDISLPFSTGYRNVYVILANRRLLSLLKQVLCDTRLS